MTACYDFVPRAVYGSLSLEEYGVAAFAFYKGIGNEALIIDARRVSAVWSSEPCMALVGRLVARTYNNTWYHAAYLRYCTDRAAESKLPTGPSGQAPHILSIWLLPRPITFPSFAVAKRSFIFFWISSYRRHSVSSLCLCLVH